MWARDAPSEDFDAAPAAAALGLVAASSEALGPARRPLWSAKEDGEVEAALAALRGHPQRPDLEAGAALLLASARAGGGRAAGRVQRTARRVCAGARLGPGNWEPTRVGSEARRRRGPEPDVGEYDYALTVYPSHPGGRYKSHGSQPLPPPQNDPNAKGRCRAD